MPLACTHPRMGEPSISLHDTHQGSGKAAAQQRQAHQLAPCSTQLPSRCTEVQSEQLCVSTQCHGLPSIRNTACPRRPLGSIICLIIAIHSNLSNPGLGGGQHTPWQASHTGSRANIHHSPDSDHPRPLEEHSRSDGDRKSTRLNSSHLVISYAVF